MTKEDVIGWTSHFRICRTPCPDFETTRWLHSVARRRQEVPSINRKSALNAFHPVLFDAAHPRVALQPTRLTVRWAPMRSLESALSADAPRGRRAAAAGSAIPRLRPGHSGDRVGERRGEDEQVERITVAVNHATSIANNRWPVVRKPGAGWCGAILDPRGRGLRRRAGSAGRRRSGSRSFRQAWPPTPHLQQDDNAPRMRRFKF
jgi:hypothetical protein